LTRRKRVDQHVAALAPPVAPHVEHGRLPGAARRIGQDVEAGPSPDHGHALLRHVVELDDRAGRRATEGEDVERVPVEAALPVVEALERAALHGDPLRPVAAAELDRVVDVEHIGRALCPEEAEDLHDEVERLVDAPHGPAAVLRAQVEREPPLPVETLAPLLTRGMEGARRQQTPLDPSQIDAVATDQLVAAGERVEEELGARTRSRGRNTGINLREAEQPHDVLPSRNVTAGRMPAGLDS
jgi:hypothetical protein